MRIYSAFEHDTSLPSKYTCDGENVSPYLYWGGIPNNTKSLLLIVEDPDAPNPTPWIHWVVYNLPVSCNSLEEDLQTLPEMAQFGVNSWGKQTYRGPCLPNGEYRYFFRLYALDIMLNISPNVATCENLLLESKDHILAIAELKGRYRRNRECYTLSV